MTTQSRHPSRQSGRRIGSSLAVLSMLAGCAGEPVCDAGDGAAVGALTPLAAGAGSGDGGALLLGVLLVPVGAAIGAIVGALSDCPAAEDQPPAPAAADEDRRIALERQCAAAAASARRQSCDKGLGSAACRTAIARANEECVFARPTPVDGAGSPPPALP